MRWLGENRRRLDPVVRRGGHCPPPIIYYALIRYSLNCTTGNVADAGNLASIELRRPWILP